MNKRQFRIALTLVFLAYAILTAYWWITIHRPYEKYPPWTKEEKIKINKIFKHHGDVTLIRNGDELYFYRDGQRIGV